MKIRPFLEGLTDAQLRRVADATGWNRSVPTQGWVEGSIYSPHRIGCLLCHASGNHYNEFRDIQLTELYGPPPLRFLGHASTKHPAEERYMELARRRGEDFAGRRMNQMARAVLARRQLARERRNLEKLFRHAERYSEGSDALLRITEVEHV